MLLKSGRTIDKDTDDQIIKTLQEALDKLKANGAFKEIVDKYTH